MSELDIIPCDIRQAGRGRNGKNRFWCVAHKADAGKSGMKLTTCTGDRLNCRNAKSLDLDLEEYAAGIALWGSVPAIYDTSGLPPELGVHVHARRVNGAPKEIDDTFDMITFKYKRDLLDDGKAIVDRDTAIAYYLARFVGNEVNCLFCTYCGNPHTDADAFAIRPHRRHLCHSCGRFFSADCRGVSNPLALLSKNKSPDGTAKPQLSNASLDILQADYPGGIQLWASNPAIVWLADRAEEEGIHVHAYDAQGNRVVDDTYGRVRIDGIDLANDEAAYLMAQRTALSLAGQIVAVSCPDCHHMAFDRDKLAFQPRSEHTCEGCGRTFNHTERRKLLVANPLVAKLDMLESMR